MNGIKAVKFASGESDSSFRSLSQFQWHFSVQTGCSSIAGLRLNIKSVQMPSYTPGQERH